MMFKSFVLNLFRENVTWLQFQIFLKCLNCNRYNYYSIIHLVIGSHFFCPLTPKNSNAKKKKHLIFILKTIYHSSVINY